MKVVKEKVIGVRGAWVFKARLVEYVTKDQGRFNRPEVMFEKMGVDDETGFSLEDLEQIHAALRQFTEEAVFR
jgi:hypothetical protein